MSLFKNVQSQYVDDNGKARMLTYESGVCLMTSPLPPLNLPADRKIQEVTREEAEQFIKARGLEITMQDGDPGDARIQGLWVRSAERSNSGVYYGYIPIEVSDAIPGVDFIPPALNDPLRTDASSELDGMHHARKVADFLKQYTMYEYALDPEGFSKDSFVVDEDHVYTVSLLDKRLYKEDNDIMYSSRGKLIVPSEDVRERLMGFLRTQLLNDTPSVMSYRDRAVVKDYYRTLSDFRKVPEQLIFLTQASLMKWKTESARGRTQNEVITYIRPDSFEPYFYRNYNISKGQISIVQNVENGDLAGALEVAEKWVKDRVNSGYRVDDAGKAIERVTYTVYTEDGEGETIAGSPEGEKVSVMEYPGGEYAALLFI